MVKAWLLNIVLAAFYVFCFLMAGGNVLQLYNESPATFDTLFIGIGMFAGICSAGVQSLRLRGLMKIYGPVFWGSAFMAGGLLFPYENTNMVFDFGVANIVQAGFFIVICVAIWRRCGGYFLFYLRDRAARQGL